MAKKGVQKPQKTFTINRDIGRNAPRIISKIHNKGTIPSIKQLIYNPWDVDANNVDLVFDDDYFSIRDDGSGMLPEELYKFTRLGDSEKETKRYTESGRRRYGFMGFGTILIATLCNNWNMETYKGGFLSRVSEDLTNRELTSDEEIEVEVFKTDKEKHGTFIEMVGLNFDSDFSIESLEKRLQWEIPILPDFSVSINGKPIESRLIENSQKYAVNENLENAGKVEGHLYFTSRNSENSGLFVYVNGRSIGDPKERLARLVNTRGISKRLIGIVNADGLEDSIMLGSETFAEGSKGVTELEDSLSEYIRAIRRDYEFEVSNRKIKSLEEQKPLIAEEVRRTFERRGFENMTTQDKIVFSDNGETSQGHPVIFDRERKIYLLDPHHPCYSASESLNHSEISRSMLHSVIDCMALNLIGEEKGAQLKKYLSIRDAIWRKFSGEEVELEQVQSSISPIKLYSALDLTKKATSMEISAKSIRDAVDSGLIKSDAGNIKGEDFLDFEKKYNGFITLYDLVRKIGFESHETAHFNRASSVLERAGNNVSPFAYDVSFTEDPFYVLERYTANEVWSLISSINLRKSTEDPREMFEKFGKRLYSVKGLVGILGEAAKRVPEIIDYGTKDERVNLSYKGKRDSSDETNKRFDFSGFTRAYQLMRGCDWILEMV